VHQRYKLRRSIVITSNRVVQDWGKYLGDVSNGMDAPTRNGIRVPQWKCHQPLNRKGRPP